MADGPAVGLQEKLACRRMARQATLFGKAAVKEPFFKISSECSSYYRTINALWQLHLGNDRQELFRAAQDQWSAKYKGNDDAVAALLERVELQGRSSTDGRRLMPSFLWATGRSSKEPVADEALPSASTTGTASTDNTDVEVVLSVSGARKPLAMLCDALDVNPSSFLTEDVVGKASVVATLTTVAERFALYRSEKRHYESSRLFHWQSSKLGQLMSKVDNQTDIVKSLMLEVSSIRIDPKLLLTTIGAQSVNKKMSLLGNLTAAVTILGHHLEAAIQRLQIRNSQICGRSLRKSQGEIRLNCLNCPELTWVETTDNLMEAASGGVLGAPLDAQQLMKIAETLQTTNALSLIEIVEGLDLDSACDDRFLARVSTIVGEHAC